MRVIEVAIWSLYLASTALSFTLVSLLWQNRNRVGAVPLAVLNAAIGFWMGCLFVSTVTPTQIGRLAVKVMFLGIGIVVASTVVFALEYTGRERYITKRALAGLAVHPVAVSILAVINPDGIFFSAIEPKMIGLELQWGPAFWIHAAYSYGLVLVAASLLVVFLITTSHRIYRIQSLALVLAIVVGLVLNVVYTVGDVFFSTSALGFLGSSALLTFAVLRYRLADLTPIAREKVIDNIRDGMIVVDRDDQVVEINQAAKALFEFPDNPVGSRLPELLPENSELGAEYDRLDAETAIERTVEYEDTFLVIDATPIENDRGNHVGWLLLIEEITERVTRERELQRKNERLDQFASMVSHDLRNPLNVAQLRADLIDHSDENAEIVEDALDRMETMIDEMLTMARAGQTIETTEPIRLSTVVTEAWESVRTDGVELEIDLDEITVECDRNRLQRVFENLFRNTVEHGADTQTPQEPLEHSSTSLPSAAAEDDDVGDLIVRVGPLEGGNGFYVEDTGTGLSDDRQEIVFEHEYTTSETGSGYGLGIVQDIVEAHGWTITATESDSGGARFEIVTS